jgi:galactokinase
MIEKIIEEFRKKYQTNPDFVVRSPGRINLIGEHTDYNDGFVFPMAIEFSQWLALKANDAKRVRLYSADINKSTDFSVNSFNHDTREKGWAAYTQGIAWNLDRHGYQLNGFDGLLLGDLPIGAGLSSSAALDMVTIKALSLVSDIPWDGKLMASLAKEADNQWVGINSGIMDQLISAMGEHGKALLIDCRSLDLEYDSLPESTIVVVMNTMAKHTLVSSGYNTRFHETREAAKFFGLSSLRDLSLKEFEAESDQMDDILRRRTRHVLTENQRTLEAAEKMRQNDPAALGSLMNESHYSLQHDYEVSCEELDIMVEESRKIEGCYGARMTGGGFGGSAIALVEKSSAEAFMKQIRAAYLEKTGIKSDIFASEPAQGTTVEYSG